MQQMMQPTKLRFASDYIVQDTVDPEKFEPDERNLDPFEEPEEPEKPLSEEERRKTIECMLKMLNFQMAGVEEKYKEIETDIKRTD